MTLPTAPPELCPPHLPVEVFKDWLEEVENAHKMR